MATPVTNFGKVTVSTGYDAAATSIALTAGHGSRLPSTFSYPLVWWNSTDYPDPADDPNREIVTVTNRSGDTLTVTRGAESSGASTKNTPGKTYKMALTITKEMWEELQARALSQSFRGLVAQNHPDFDQTSAKVLFSADAIVMDDGEEVHGWTNVVADLAATGAGGLDTGSEQPSAWYSLWAIYNGTTKAGLWHREKTFLYDTGYTTGADGAHPLRFDAARTRLSQGFQLAAAGPVPFVDVQLYKTGAPTGNYWFTIETNSGGVPSGTVLATSDKYSAAKLLTGTGGYWVRLPFRTPASLSVATQYHLVLHGDYTVSSTNYINWRADTTAATYANGAKAQYDGTTWTTDTDDDFMFKVYVTQYDTAVVLPSGYTKKALLGYWYNDVSSNLKQAMQRGRHVFTGRGNSWDIGSLAAADAQLIDASAFVPPVPVLAEIAAYNSGAAIHFAPGDLRATDLISSSIPGPLDLSLTITTAAAGHVQDTSPFPITYQGFMLFQGGLSRLHLIGFEW